MKCAIFSVAISVMAVQQVTAGNKLRIRQLQDENGPLSGGVEKGAAKSGTPSSKAGKSSKSMLASIEVADVQTGLEEVSDTPAVVAEEEEVYIEAEEEEAYIEAEEEEEDLPPCIGYIETVEDTETVSASKTSKAGRPKSKTAKLFKSKTKARRHAESDERKLQAKSAKLFKKKSKTSKMAKTSNTVSDTVSAIGSPVRCRDEDQTITEGDPSDIEFDESISDEEILFMLGLLEGSNSMSVDMMGSRALSNADKPAFTKRRK